jgi:hypothetical protein
VSVQAAREPVSVQSLGSSSSLDEVWHAALEAGAGARRLRLLMEECVPLTLAGGVVRLRTNPGMLSAVRAQGKEIEAILARVRGAATTLEFEDAAAPSAPGASVEATPAQDAGAAAADHPLVKRTIELFNAKLVGVQPRKAKE